MNLLTMALEISFSSTLLFYFFFMACVLLEIRRDKLGPVDSGRVLRPITFNFRLVRCHLQSIIARLASGRCNEYIVNSYSNSVGTVEPRLTDTPE